MAEPFFQMYYFILHTLYLTLTHGGLINWQDGNFGSLVKQDQEILTESRGVIGSLEY